MIEVVPAIIPENFEHLLEEVEKVAPFVSRIQIDVMDGIYAPTKSWPYSDDTTGTLMFEKLVNKEESLPELKTITYELDMMVEKPENHFLKWINAGIKSLIIHVESTKELQSIINTAREKYVGVGIALKPRTPIESIYEWIDGVSSTGSPNIDFVQFMGNNNIGYHGMSLDSFVLPKISQLRKKYPELIIGIDIGVNIETAPILVESGVTKLVSGSAIFKSDDIEKTIETFKTLDLKK